ncbi:MAG: DUF302 domain-containing protein [Acidobacteria bacterium]|nr:DUF302 domain-containing protein [Acidobacteriota bacterium]
MSNEPSATTYVLQEPYEKALKLLRTELENEGLRVPVEMDVSGEIRAELGLDLRPCRVLYVCCPWLLLQAAVIDRSTVAFLPLRLVVSGRSYSETVVRVVRSTNNQDSSLDRRVTVLASTLLDRVQRIVEKICAPQLV